MTPISALIGVLFVGHSLFGKVNPQMLKQVLQGQSSSIQVEAQIINGAPLKYNWSHSSRAEGVDGRVELPKKRYNVVILTEAIPLANHMKWSQPSENALNFYELAVKANPGTQVYLEETWHSLNSGTGVKIKHDDNADIAWRDRLDQDLPKWQSIVDDVNAARSTGSPDMILLPAGQAMALLHDEIKAGSVPGLTDISDVFSDDIHPNHIGFYFVTMVQFAMLTGQSPIGLPHRLKGKYGKFFDAPSAELALRLQQIAAQVVEDRSNAALLPTETKAQKAETETTEPEPQSPTRPQTQPASLQDPPSATGPVPMAVGLSPVNDWSVQQPFLDVMKTARSWIGHKPGEWGGMTFAEFVSGGYLDENGWPKSKPKGIKSIGTMILTDLPEVAASMVGRYRLRFEGKGLVEVGGRATNKSYGKNEVQFDFTPGSGSVQIRISARTV